MHGDAAILAEVEAAFGRCARPRQFANASHCPECEEHDRLLRSRTRTTLAISDVGNPGWDPLCFVTDEGFAYFFPALARLTLSEPDRQHGWYLGQLLFHLTHKEGENRHLRFFDPPQRAAVVRLLGHVLATRADQVESDCLADELFAALELWGG